MLRPSRWRHVVPVLLALPLLPAHGGPVAGEATRAPEAVAINDNRRPAGVWANGTLVLRLDVRAVRWHPQEPEGTPADVFAFAEAGAPASIPGPLVRVPRGTRLVVELHNPLAVPLTVHGLHARPSRGDSVTLRPGERRQLRFGAGAPGTYFYWATTRGATLETRRADESQLHGAFIVDPDTVPRPARDRVFVLGDWHVPTDTTEAKPWVDRDVMVINGKSYPHTEAFTFTAGDSVRWRWVNPTRDAHPMHLHGFYFRVRSRGSGAADTILAPRDRRLVVTELMVPGSTMDLEWRASAAGNWLFHCHFAFHVSHFLSVDKVPDDADPTAPDSARHHAHAMRGLVLALTVRPRTGAARGAARDAASSGVTASRPTREIRVVARAQPGRFGATPGYAYVVDPTGTRSRDALPTVSDPLVLRRGEPVRVTVVNALQAPTAVHWHGIEMDDAYSDGVPGWSGAGTRLAPAIAPGDSFVATFTPPRAGTFIYHAHSHEGFQISHGLYGALVVTDGAVPRLAPTDRLLLIGGSGMEFSTSRANGLRAPAPIEIAAGARHRLRVVFIHPDARMSVALRAEGTRAGDTTTAPVAWRHLAKDGAELPAHRQRLSEAPTLMGPGETMDVELFVARPGRYVVDVYAKTPSLRQRVPIIVR